MKTALSALALCAALGLSTAATAQVPSGGAGSDAKGNAPLKHAHTVNDGAARRGHNSFTEGQARKHIEKAGYQSVTGLAKGDDGVWRGTAMKNGASVPVGMDFKGNVSEGVAPGSQAGMMSSTTTSSTMPAPAPMASADQPAAAPMKTECTTPPAAIIATTLGRVAPIRRRMAPRAAASTATKTASPTRKTARSTPAPTPDVAGGAFDGSAHPSSRRSRLCAASLQESGDVQPRNPDLFHLE